MSDQPLANKPNQLKVLTLGHTGVIVDENILEPTVPDDAFRIAQNIIQDPRVGFGGGVRKRPGLIPFTPFTGSVILGGIPMPLAAFGSAPSGGGGAQLGTGDSGDTLPAPGGSPSNPILGSSPGTGDMTGAPGATFGAPPSAPNGIGQFNSGGLLFGGKRMIIVGRLGGDAPLSNQGGSGWYLTSKGLADVAINSSVPASAKNIPVSSYSFPANAPFGDDWGQPSCIDNIGITGLYYAAVHGNQVGNPYTLPCLIRNTDGTIDNLVTTIPPATNVNAGGAAANLGLVQGSVIFTDTGNGGYRSGDNLTVVGGAGSAATITLGAGLSITVTFAGSYTAAPASPFAVSGGSGTGGHMTGTFAATPARSAIMALHFGLDGFIYAGIKDKYTGQDTAGSAGRILRIAPLTGQVTEWNTGQVSSTPVFLAAIPYCVNYFRGYLYWGEVGYAADVGSRIGASDGTQGVIDRNFAGDPATASAVTSLVQFNGRLWAGCGVNSAAPGLAQLLSRSPTISNTDPAAWTGHSFDLARVGNTTNGNFYPSMAVFNNVLYVCWNAPGTATQIYSVVPVSPTQGPESTAYTITSVASNAGVLSNGAYNLYVDQDTLYLIATTASGPSTEAFITTDGITFTNKNATFTNLGNASRFVPVFFAVNQ